MLDLFGNETTAVYRGQPIKDVSFSDEEAELFAEEVLFSGILIEQLAADLKKISRIGQDDSRMTHARREAWSGLIWAFDLWASPARITFDTACDLVGADSEVIRAAISVEFGAEIRLMCSTIAGRFPDEGKRVAKKLARYVDLRVN